ncbi:MAG: MFS transporter [Pirellulales bacterium]|nr:MFS transporter [Pirellulales bacterium]
MTDAAAEGAQQDEASAAGESTAGGARSLPRAVKLLGWASFANDVATEAVFPLLPLFVTEVLGGGKKQLGLIEGVADSTASLLKLASGAWSDRLQQRKGLIVVGYVLAAAVRPLLGLAQAPWHVLAVRGVDRVGKGLRTAPRDALIADVTPPEQRGAAFGYHRAMDHLGAALGPLLATAFLWFRPQDLRTLFLLTALPGLAVVAIVVFGLREPARHVIATPPEAATRGPLTRNFLAYLAILCLFTLGNSSDAFLLVRASELGVTAGWLPGLWLTFSLLKGVGNLGMGPAVQRIGPRRLIRVGWVCYALVYGGFALATQWWHAWLLFAAYAIFYALTEPAEKTLVANLVAAQQRGQAFGWFNFSLGVAALPASLLFGWLYDEYGAAGAFGFGAGVAIFAAVLLGLVHESRGDA